MRRRFGRKGNVSEVSPGDALPDPDGQKRARSKAYDSAIRLLARREHAKAEIRQKLKIRGYDESLATEIVDDLTRSRLLSDERFAEVFIRSRAERGQGAVRLRSELRHLNLPSELIESRIAAARVDWARLARDIRLRKFGENIPKAPAERAKQMRFLQYRGFTADQIRRAMGASFEEDHLLDVAEADSADSHLD
jgi:regulatory protein